MAIFLNGKKVRLISRDKSTELYDPAAAELNKRHSHSSGAVVVNNKIVITDYIDITETMKGSDPKLSIVLNPDCFYSATNRITYYDENKTYLSRSGASWAPGGSFTTTWSDSYHATLHLGLFNGVKLDFYNQIRYVRIEVQVKNTSAQESDRYVFLSITDPDEVVTKRYTNAIPFMYQKTGTSGFIKGPDV